MCNFRKPIDMLIVLSLNIDIVIYNAIYNVVLWRCNRMYKVASRMQVKYEIAVG